MNIFTNPITHNVFVARFRKIELFANTSKEKSPYFWIYFSNKVFSGKFRTELFEAFIYDFQKNTTVNSIYHMFVTEQEKGYILAFEQNVTLLET